MNICNYILVNGVEWFDKHIKERTVIFSIIVFIIASLFSSCMSDETKLEKMIAEAAKKNLYYPDSYDPVELECDTLKITIIDDKYLAKADSMYNLFWEINTLNTNIYNYNWEIENQRGMTKKYYDDRRIWMQDAINEKRNAENHLLSILCEIEAEYWGKKGGFYGFFVVHRFRARQHNGNVCFVNYFFILDKSKEKVLKVYNADGGNFQHLLKVTEIMKELGNDNYLKIKDDSVREKNLKVISNHFK